MTEKILDFSSASGTASKLSKRSRDARKLVPLFPERVAVPSVPLVDTKQIKKQDFSSGRVCDTGKKIATKA
jgi:hypothetical protein